MLKLEHGKIYINGEGSLIYIRKLEYDCYHVGFSVKNNTWMGYYHESGVALGGTDKTKLVKEADPLLLVEVINSLRSGLYFYSDTENWNKIDTGIGETDGPAVDWGDKAKEALKGIEKLVKKHFSA